MWQPVTDIATVAGYEIKLPAGVRLCREVPDAPEKPASIEQHCMDAIEHVDAMLTALPDDSPLTRTAMLVQVGLANLYNVLSSQP